MPRGRRRQRNNKIVTERQAHARFEGLSGSLIRKNIITDLEVSDIVVASDSYLEALPKLIRYVNGKLAQRGKATAR